MENTPHPTTHGSELSAPSPTASADEGLSTLSSLLTSLDRDSSEHVAAGGPVLPDDLSAGGVEHEYQNQLVQVRLGLASSLFAALRAKHGPTASHCLRVALGCSSWSQIMELAPAIRDQIEVAALLHDIGKIGVPDHVLLKPGKLTREEAATINRHRLIGEQILLSCCASAEVLDIVKYTPAWFDGSKPGFDRSGESLPLGARIVSILDAFDAMTTDQVYRRAMSRERAMAELFRWSGTQFDGLLVEQFCDLLVSERIKMTSDIARRWLHELSGDSSDAFWKLTPPCHASENLTLDRLFHEKLLDSMHDGVIFIDTSLRVLLWNRAAERLTGLPVRGVLQKRWAPSLIGMRDENNARMTFDDCPVAHALSTGVQTLRRLTVHGRGGERLSVDAHMIPVVGRDGVMYGATLLLHDASSQITLEERVQTLHEKATRDPLTKVGNRAEFDRVLSQFVESHLERKLPCALIICDIDHFKTINDTYGHQAGDEALVNFAALLQRSCLTGDLVARYGGEEFVMLSADCDNSTATDYAEKVRRELSEMPQPSLDGRAITASFGVTEIQSGDTPETMLRRADRALLRAKENGRNRVVQLGTGIPQDERRSRGKSWWSWFRRPARETLLEKTLITAVPLRPAIEKLKGFVSDHHAEIVSMEDERLLLQISGQTTISRRTTDRPMNLFISLQFVEQQAGQRADEKGPTGGTLIRVLIQPTRSRDRRLSEAHDRARQILCSLKSYFMADEYSGSVACTTPTAQPRAGGWLASLFGKDTDRPNA